MSETLVREKTDDATINTAAVERAITSAHQALGGRQKADGHWIFELEADATIPAEYVLLEHYLDRIDTERQAKIGVYLRRIQGKHGGWPLYHDGGFDLSASIKAYFALKAIGDDIDAPHMARAREAILDHGGAARSNVFTRFQLALFGEAPWSATPVMPVELMLLPRKAFFSLWNMSYWSRTVIAPLLVLAALRPKAINPHKVSVRELFVQPPEDVKDWNLGPFRSKWGHVFKHVDTVLRPIVPRIPRKIHDKAIQAAIDFIEPRLSKGGLGAIYPAMANVVMMYRALGVPDNDPRVETAWQSIHDLLVEKEDEIYCQPCVSPVWDTGLSGLAMMEAATGPRATKRDETIEALKRSASWLRDRQILDVKGDWIVNTAPDLRPGGWAFQYENDYYPDVDDTAVVGMLLHRLDPEGNKEAIERAREWIIGMQSTNGGWGAFDIDNDMDFLNHIPFADHGALLDPPTADVSARCVSFLAQLGHTEDRPTIERALAYLRQEQEEDGSWFGRWGTNFIYGTWSVLCALNIAGIPHSDPMIQRAVAWLKRMQREDGGWGEDCASYEGAASGQYKESLPSQTAWAVLGLMAVGERDSDAVKNGIQFLAQAQDEHGEWHEEPYNAVGFPKVFYLRYHGYKQFFPLTALARYRNLGDSNTGRVEVGF
ncbi:squalene-hopene cyclase [Neokomagataea thailandica NBRC 106555]|uniref:Squalene--hopene cyclase n=2 Tax=Neokomagataea TaxID=1223423 RepID=A0A4Y6V6I6_9PROT|nr:MULTISPECIES: squalene--hopene cyclase [Neokomagataea]QDH25593.1 squalene--hopene cyclase [Neokomagataea tanensis]GBR52597.1 squalene-hopene cyclase [Neokomagataea thailandica NBRC 106555]